MNRREIRVHRSRMAGTDFVDWGYTWMPILRAALRFLTATGVAFVGALIMCLLSDPETVAAAAVTTAFAAPSIGLHVILGSLALRRNPRNLIYLLSLVPFTTWMLLTPAFSEDEAALEIARYFLNCYLVACAYGFCCLLWWGKSGRES